MARRNSIGEIRLWFVPSIANTAAPTVAEITAGTDLTPQLLRDGLTTPNSGNTIDASDAASRFNKTAPGTRGGDAIGLTLQRDSASGSDTAWTTLVEDTTGNLVVRRFGGATTAVAIGNVVEVYSGTVINREMAPIGDQTQRFNASFSVEAAPVLNATVA